MKELPLIRSGKAALISALLLAVPILLLSLDPILGVYAIALIALLMPAGVCLAALTGGIAPACAGIAASVIACAKLAGTPGMICVLLYLLPVFGVFLYIHGKKIPFFKGCAAQIITHMLAAACVYLYLQQLFNQQLYRTAADGVMAFLATQPECDSLLYMFFQQGLISLTTERKEELQALLLLSNISGTLTFSPEIRQEMLLSLGSLAEELLFELTLMFFTLQAVLSGVACMLLPQRFGKLLHAKEEFLAQEGALPAPFPELDMPPLSLWHIPRGLGWKVGGVWLVGSLLQGMNAAQGIQIAGAILHHCTTGIFAWQGAALLNFTQKARGTKRVFRVTTPLLLLILGVLPYMGIFDQIINLRGLRKPPEPKEDF